LPILLYLEDGFSEPSFAQTNTGRHDTAVFKL